MSLSIFRTDGSCWNAAISSCDEQRTTNAGAAMSVRAESGSRERRAPVLSNPFDVFDSADALVLNQARMDHLESLNLTIKGKSVLDVGCGVGYFSQWWLDRGANVMAIDARPENVLETMRRVPSNSECSMVPCSIEERHLFAIRPGYPFRLLPDQPKNYDIVFCYGLLYHLTKPAVALENMRKACKGILLLETIVLDSWDAELLMVAEDSSVRNQGLHPTACRPSWGWLCQALRSVGFEHLYATLEVPRHPDFTWVSMNSKDWRSGIVNYRRIILASVAPMGRQAGLVKI